MNDDENARASGTTRAPLHGLRVIDFTHVLAGPACAYFLGLLGAEVIKVESVTRGDAMRHRGGSDAAAAAAGASTAYRTQASPKLSLSVDVASTEGRTIFLELLGTADVLVQNHRPSTMRRLGLGDGVIAAAAPQLVHCALSGYGRGGEDTDVPAYDINVQAASGLMSLTGDETTGPTRTGAPVMDYASALAAAFGVMTALFERERRGGTGPAVVDVSMFATAMTLMSSTVSDYRLSGKAPLARGNAANSRSPGAGTFETAEGLLSLGVNEQHQFEALAHVCERPDWIDDARFAGAGERDAHRAAFVAELEAVLRTRTAPVWESALVRAGVPAARVATLPEALVRRPLDVDGRLPLPFRFDGQGFAPPAGVDAAPLGAHTRRLLHELGRDDAEIDALAASGLVRA